MSRKRILVLLHDELMPPDSIEGMTPQEVHPFAQEYDVLSTLQNLGHEVKPLGVSDELAPIRRAIDEWKPDIAFNLLTHFHGVGTYDSYVVSYLELLRCAYTGCNPRGLMLANDKVLSKKILTWHRIPIPRFAVYPMGRRAKAPPKLEFPLFVKSAAEHASVGISQASIVHDEESLAERVAFIHRTASTDAIAEQYIEGRELSVAVMGNTRLTVFPVWEMRFEKLPRGTAPIATSKVKWDLDYQEKIGVSNGPARRLPDGKAEEITRMAKRIYRALGLTGYVRIDIRLAEDGRLYVLEANPNPDLCHDEDFADSAKAAGIDYESLVQRIVNLGLRHAEAWHER